MLKKLLGEEKGSVIIMVTIALIVLLGFTGLVIDGGALYMTKSKLQNAADAAALAGASVSAADADGEAKKYAGLNGVVNGVDGATVQVELIAATETGTTYEKAYSDAELADMRTELQIELNTMSNPDLIAFAEANSVTVGLTTTTTNHTDTEITLKRTELSTILNGMSDSDLIASAKENSVTTGLATTTEYKYTSEYIASIDGMGDLTVINLAKENSIYDQISQYVKKGVEFQNKGDRVAAKGVVKNGLKNIVESTTNTINDKSALIAALLDIQMAAFEKEVITTSTINDKDLLKAKLLEIQMADLAKQEIKKTQGHPARVKVTCTEPVSPTFVRVLGFANDTVVSASAVAENGKWTGEALPFINVDDNFSVAGDKIEAWETASPGDKERIHDWVVEVPSSNRITLTIKDDNDGAGPYLLLKGGYAVGSKIPTALKNIVLAGNTVYLLSLKNDLIPDYGQTYKPNKYHMPMDKLVLLKCTVYEDWGGESVKTCYLTLVESYDWDAEKETFDTGGSPKLVE